MQAPSSSSSTAQARGMGKRELLKVIVLGAANVGKTSMMKRYTTDKFIADRRPTIGADFMTKKVRVEGTDVLLQIWDTAGQVAYTCILTKNFESNLIFKDLLSFHCILGTFSS